MNREENGKDGNDDIIDDEISITPNEKLLSNNINNSKVYETSQPHRHVEDSLDYIAIGKKYEVKFEQLTIGKVCFFCQR